MNKTATDYTDHKEVTMSVSNITVAGSSVKFAEACEHAQLNYRNTNGLVAGGDYMVKFSDGTVREVQLRVNPVNGLVRPIN